MKKSSVLKFIAILFLCGLAGGTAAVLIGLNDHSLSWLFRSAYSWLATHIFAVEIVCGTVILGASLALYCVSRRRFRLCAGEPDQVDEKVAPLIDIGIVINSCLYIFMFILYSVVVQEIETVWGALVFMLFCVGAFVMELKYVKFVKRLYPKRKGDPLSLKFAEEWLQSCDELERRVAYLSAYKTMLSLRYLLIILFALFMLIGISFPIGILPQLVLGVIWLYINLYNLFVTRKLTRSGNFE